MHPLALLLLRLLARLPLPVLHGVGAVLGWLSWWVPNPNKTVALRNLELCFPERGKAERRALARRYLIEAGKTLTETTALWLGDLGRLRAYTREVRGGERLEQALAQGKGAIIVSPHIGSWEYVGLYCAALHPMTCLYRPARKQGLEAVVIEGRERMGMRLAPTDTKGVRILLQALKANELIGILPDQDPRDEAGAFAPFFGVPAKTMTLLPRLAHKSGAPVFFACAERLPWGRGYRLHFLPAPAGIDSADVTTAVTALNQGVEQCVRLAPEQYQWAYKRFRTRPEGEPPLYP
jgi:KDO2-lipid IV(A) lauroyltransferase